MHLGYKLKMSSDELPHYVDELRRLFDLPPKVHVVQELGEFDSNFTREEDRHKPYADLSVSVAGDRYTGQFSWETVDNILAEMGLTRVEDIYISGHDKYGYFAIFPRGPAILGVDNIALCGVSLSREGTIYPVAKLDKAKLLEPLPEFKW